MKTGLRRLLALALGAGLLTANTYAAATTFTDVPTTYWGYYYIDRAATEALEHFSLCPICKRLVCDRCFLLGEDIDLCTDCAAFLQESGEPVENSFTKHG